MHLLIVTHALLWWLTDHAKLLATAWQRLGDEGNQVLVSAVSAWEIATQQRIGKLQGSAPVARWYTCTGSMLRDCAVRPCSLSLPKASRGIEVRRASSPFLFAWLWRHLRWSGLIDIPLPTHRY